MWINRRCWSKWCPLVLKSRPLCSSSDDFVSGELAIATDKKGRQHMFQVTEDGQLQLHQGTLNHKDILAGTPGAEFHTHLGAKLRIRRPSLEEYALHMRRAATPAYPKDILAMMGMLDIGPGCRVLEAGSGSGALTLYLSRAVGPDGCVFSFDVSERHLNRASENYRLWLSNVRLRGSNSWPDNVHFFHADIAQAADHIDTEVDAVALDMLDPCPILCAAEQLLRPCAVLATYLPNITQVIDLVAHIRRQGLNLYPEGVIEVQYRRWTVKPAWSKHRRRWPHPQTSGTATATRQGSELRTLPDVHTPAIEPGDSTSVLQMSAGELESVPAGGGDDGESRSTHPSTSNDGCYSEASLPYIARPSHLQNPHTAFLVKLRKLPGHSRAHRVPRGRDQRDSCVQTDNFDN